MNDRDFDSHGNCSKCGGTHYGSYMCPMSPSPQGEDPTPDRGPLVGNTSKPVATEPQGNAGESPAPIPLTSNSLIQYLRVCADLAEAPGDDQDGLAYVSPIKLREAITEIERLTRENESLRAGRTNSQRVNDNGAQEIDRMRAALDETLEELQLDDSRHDLMAKIISALSGEPGSAPETKPPRCPHYWHEHGNRCVLEEGHRSEHYFTAPASAIDPDKEFRWPPLKARTNDIRTAKATP